VNPISVRSDRYRKNSPTGFRSKRERGTVQVVVKKKQNIMGGNCLVGKR
jgi:hypothetical protein